jgi:hypothetical protein
VPQPRELLHRHHLVPPTILSFLINISLLGSFTPGFIYME